MARGWKENFSCASMDGEEVAMPLEATTVLWAAGAGGAWAGQEAGGNADDGAGIAARQAEWPSPLRECSTTLRTLTGLSMDADCFGSLPPCTEQEDCVDEGLTNDASFPGLAHGLAGQCMDHDQFLVHHRDHDPQLETTVSHKRQASSLSSSLEDSVAALLPKMKRMRLKPSFGQLRLQREAEDTDIFPPEVKLALEPEQLRATLTIEMTMGGSVGSDLVYLEISFPPQYPHRPPKICQVAPENYLPFWRYKGPFILLDRLEERAWSPAMGVSDIVKDLLRPMGWIGPEGLWAFDSLAETSRLQTELGDAEMA